MLDIWSPSVWPIVGGQSARCDLGKSQTPCPNRDRYTIGDPEARACQEVHRAEPGRKKKAQRPPQRNKVRGPGPNAPKHPYHTTHLHWPQRQPVRSSPTFINHVPLAQLRGPMTWAIEAEYNESPTTGSRPHLTTTMSGGISRAAMLVPAERRLKLPPLALPELRKASISAAEATRCGAATSVTMGERRSAVEFRRRCDE